MKNILFVGAFNNNNKDGSTGGQLFRMSFTNKF